MIELMGYLIIDFVLIFIAMCFVYFGILIERRLHEKYHWASGRFYQLFGLLVFIGYLFTYAMIFLFVNTIISRWI